MKDLKTHWDEIYRTKQCTELSWYEPMPETSLNFIKDFNLEKDSAILDVGGGDSVLAEFLLAQEYQNLSVLDISDEALECAKARIGDRAGEVNWIQANVTSFQPKEQYDLWHDRAAFHFLTDEADVQKYLEALKKAVKAGGYVLMATFAKNGPESCSELPVKRYGIGELQDLFEEGFRTLGCKNVDHTTPSGEVQSFTFCSFQKRD
ncbi:trans-aconitate 2-methyltransferase [Zunongwangia sp. H14]|uniref:class I SAM-dependent methyltransferase n=1 Tax=Zunongwangia sp. H14 TaxID=3240792 RepID=UPI0035676758